MPVSFVITAILAGLVSQVPWVRVLASSLEGLIISASILWIIFARSCS